jgi:hypothetical protein
VSVCFWRAPISIKGTPPSITTTKEDTRFVSEVWGPDLDVVRISATEAEHASGPCPIVIDDVSKDVVGPAAGPVLHGRQGCEMEPVFLQLVRGNHHSLITTPPSAYPAQAESGHGVGIIRGRCSLTFSSRVAAFGSQARLATLQLAGFRPGTRRRWRHWMATKASQITKPVARSRPQHVFRLAEGVRAMRSLSFASRASSLQLGGNDSSASRDMPGHRYSDTISRSYRDMARAAPQSQTWFVRCCGTRGEQGSGLGQVRFRQVVVCLPRQSLSITACLVLLRGVFLSSG